MTTAVERAIIDAARERVLACSRSLVARGLVVGSSGNVSERIDEHHFVVTPAGVVYEALAVGDIPVVDARTGEWADGLRPTSELALHLGLYRSDPELRSIVHTHSRHAAAFAVARVDLPFIMNENIATHSEKILVTDYAPPGSVDLGEQALRTFSRQPGSQAILLANHGVVALGESLDKAELVAAQVEWIAEVAYLSSTLRPGLGPTVVLPREMQDAIGHNYGVSFAREPRAAIPSHSDEIVRALGLEPLPVEGGLFRQIWQSAKTGPDGRPLGTSILAAFTEDADSFSSMHRLATTEIWHASVGDAIQMLLLHPDGSHTEPVLGLDVLAGQRLQIVVPGGTWMGASLVAGGRFGVFGATMAPGFVESDFAGGVEALLADGWPAAATRIRALTRAGAPTVITDQLRSSLD